MCNKYRYLINKFKVNYSKINVYVIMLNKPIKWPLIKNKSNFNTTNHNKGKITLKNWG